MAGCSSSESSVLTINALNLGIQKIKDVELTGIPTAPTAFLGNNTNQIATTAFVLNQVAQSTTGVSTFTGGTTGLTPNVPTTGNIELSGVLSPANGGTGATSLDFAGITTLAGSQTITGAKTITGALGITEQNPRPATWPAYARSKAPTHPAMVFDAGTSGNSIASAFYGGAGGGDVVLFASFAYGNVNTAVAVGNIGSQGTSTIYATTSDYRLKENVLPLTGALSKLAMLKPVTFDWKLTGESDEGFIAHELAEVCPHAVSGKKDELYPDGTPKYQGIDTSFLVAMLTSAMQEQQALITNLTNRITALEGA